MQAHDELRGDFVVGQAFGDHVRDLVLPCGKQRDAFSADYARRFPLRQGFENPPELSAVSPDLPGVYTPNTFTQCLERVGLTNDTLGTCGEGVEHLLRAREIQ